MMASRDREQSASKPGYYGYTVVAAASVIMVLIFAVQYSFGVFFKPVLTEFGWTRAMTAGAFSLVWITQGIVSVLMGGLNDRLGPRIVLTVCGTLIGAGFLLMSQIGALWQLYVFYGVIVGAGLGGTFVPLTSTTARWFVARRGLMTGIVTAGVGLGAFIGPPIANWLITTYAWRRSYATLGGVVLGGVLIGAQFLRRDPAQIGRTPYAHGDAADAVKHVATGLALREVLASRMFWIVVAAFFCYGFSLQAIMLHLAPHATDLGMSAATSAGILASIGGASIIGKVVLGVLADRIGNKRVYLVSFVLMIAALSWLLVARDVWALYLFGLVFGFAYGGLATAHSPLVAWLFGMRKHGLIFGVSFNGWTIGCATGPIVAGYVFDVSHSYQVAFAICAALAFVGLLLTTLLAPVGAKGQPADGLSRSRRTPVPAARPIAVD
jgi:MFS transporter, OFA family, oxalate/formate antiporter